MKILATSIVALAMIMVSSPGGNAKEPVYVGLSAPLTGKNAEYGKHFEEGIAIAVERINDSGGLGGRPLVIISRDSKGLPDISKRIAIEFTKDKRIVAEIGDFTSSCSMAAAPIYKLGKMVQLSPTASHPSFAPSSPFSFSIIGSSNIYSMSLARGVVKHLRKKKLAVLFINNDWGIASKKVFIEEAKRLGAVVVAEEHFLEGTNDFRPVIEKLRAASPELVYLSMMMQDTLLFCKQLKSAGWDDVSLLAPPVHSHKLIELGRDMIENLYVASPFLPNESQPMIREFTKAFEAMYNEAPNTYAAQAYDALNILAEAIRKAGTNRISIRDELNKLREYQGVSGKMTFTVHGDVIKKWYMFQVKNGEFVLIGGK